jgi:hypothetical protein
MPPVSINMKSNRPKIVAYLIILCAIGALIPSYAEVPENIEILLDDTTLGTSIENGESVTSEGVTMTISGLVAADGGDFGDVEDWGVLFGSDPESSDVVSFDIAFDVDVRITGYQIGSREDVPDGVFFEIAGADGSSGPNPVPESEFTLTEICLPYVPGSLPMLKAGLVYTISHNLADFSLSDPLFNFEALFVAPVTDDLEVEVQFAGPKTGQFTVQSEVGFTYSLRRSTDLVSDSEVSSISGDGTPLVFPFDDSGSPDSRGFFWIRRTKD